MTTSPRRSVLLDEILYEIGHLLIFGVMALLCVQDGEMFLASAAGAYAAVNALRLVNGLLNGVARPEAPRGIVCAGYAITALGTAIFAIFITFGAQDDTLIELLSLVGAGLALVGSAGLVARRVKLARGDRA